MKRDSMGRFTKSNVNFEQKENQNDVKRKEKNDTLLILFAVLVSVSFVTGLGVGNIYWGSHADTQSVAISQSAQSYDQDQILAMEKELAEKIIDYEIKYGTQSLSWGVNVKFQE